MLLEHDFKSTDIEHSLVAAKIVYEKCHLHFELAFNPKGRQERAAWAFVEDVFKASGAFYRRATIGLLYEVAVREARLHRCGAAARAGEDLLRI